MRSGGYPDDKSTLAALRIPHANTHTQSEMVKQKALLLLEKQGDFAVREIDVPKPEPGEILVEVRATGLNPVDWKIQKIGFAVSEYPAVLGSDSAGVVKEVGEGVAGFEVGDRV